MEECLGGARNTRIQFATHTLVGCETGTHKPMTILQVGHELHMKHSKKQRSGVHESGRHVALRGDGAASSPIDFGRHLSAYFTGLCEKAEPLGGECPGTCPTQTPSELGPFLQLVQEAQACQC